MVHCADMKIVMHLFYIRFFGDSSLVFLVNKASDLQGDRGPAGNVFVLKLTRIIAPTSLCFTLLQ